MLSNAPHAIEFYGGPKDGERRLIPSQVKIIGKVIITLTVGSAYSPTGYQRVERHTYSETDIRADDGFLIYRWSAQEIFNI